MKQLLRSFLSFALLISGTALLADCFSGCNTSGCSSASCSTSCDSECTTCHSILIPRSAGANVVREFNPANFVMTDDCFGGTFSLAFEWTRSFKGDRLAKCLFGGSNCLNFAGSAVVGSTTTCALATGTGTGLTRPATALFGSNFGISPFANAALVIDPRIDHFILDGQVQFNFENWCHGMFLRINAPFDYTRWDLRAQCTDCCPANTCSNSCSDSCSPCSNSCSNSCWSDCSNTCCNLSSCSLVTTPFAAGCVGTIAQGPITGVSSLQTALEGDFLFGTMQTPWKYGRFRFCRENEKRLADLDIILGWNFWNCEEHHFGLGIQVVAPTGTKIDACHARYFFNPVSGNGHHWELGGYLSGHAELWNCDEQSINLYVEGNVTHMFKDCQVRSFDFANKGCFSRYMLLKEFSRNADGTFSATTNLINAINYNTRFADVKVNVKGDALIQFIYQNCNWSFGLGYNIYGHSGEDLCLKDGFVDSSLNGRYFGIKGCAPVQVAGSRTTGLGAAAVITNTVAGTPLVAAYTLNATQSAATAFACGATDNALALSNLTASPGVAYLDTCASLGLNAAGTTAVNGLAVTGYTVASESASALTVTAATGAITVTTAPVILTGSSDELDIESGRAPHQLSNKVFAHIGYNWSDNDWCPYLDLGGEAEFGRKRDCCVVNQGGIWLKGGFTF